MRNSTGIYATLAMILVLSGCAPRGVVIVRKWKGDHAPTKTSSRGEIYHYLENSKDSVTECMRRIKEVSKLATGEAMSALLDFTQKHTGAYYDDLVEALTPFGPKIIPHLIDIYNRVPEIDNARFVCATTLAIFSQKSDKALNAQVDIALAMDPPNEMIAQDALTARYNVSIKLINARIQNEASAHIRAALGKLRDILKDSFLENYDESMKRLDALLKTADDEERIRYLTGRRAFLLQEARRLRNRGARSEVKQP